MPLLPSTYRKPFLFFSNHIETIYPVITRNVSDVLFQRKRLELPDGDFLDLDWIQNNHSSLLILSHGLEGSTASKYLKGFARAASNAGYDVLAWNYRGCSGEPNRNFRFYHSGESNDLDFVVQHVLRSYHYNSIALIGFSVGGNITLKYLGEKKDTLSPVIKTAVAFSVPCDLQEGALHMAKPQNSFYMNRFLKQLHTKITAKAKQFPDNINDTNYHLIKNFIDFDERYTAPLHGFKNASEYYRLCSSKPLIPFITIPTLLVNALNDPFLNTNCFPYKEAKENPLFFLETPTHGGHCGFYQNNTNGNYWSDNRALEFIKSYI